MSTELVPPALPARGHRRSAAAACERPRCGPRRLPFRSASPMREARDPGKRRLADRQEAVAWLGEVPFSTRFGDPYFSRADGLAEARHVFLAGNELPARFRPGFRIAETGFGTGLNCLAVLEAWIAAGVPGPLSFTSFEAYSIAPADMARALAAFPSLGGLSQPLLAGWAEGRRRIATDRLCLTVIEGDARETLPRWEGVADAWFLDGFAPARNPELWAPELLAAVARRTAPGGTAATYSAAGGVRAGLAAGGFAVERRPGFGHKRHMTVARLEAGAEDARAAAPGTECGASGGDIWGPMRGAVEQASVPRDPSGGDASGAGRGDASRAEDMALGGSGERAEGWG